MDQLRKLNPIFKKDIIPYNLDGYWVYLPGGKAVVFDRLKDSVYYPLPRPNDFTPVLINKEATDSSAVSSNPSDKDKQDNPSEKKFDKKRVYYKVKKGDNLKQVADWFDVSEKEIVSWNKLHSTKLIKNKRLTIWVNEKKTGYYKRINTMSNQQKKKLLRKD